MYDSIKIIRNASKKGEGKQQNINNNKIPK